MVNITLYLSCLVKGIVFERARRVPAVATGGSAAALTASSSGCGILSVYRPTSLRSIMSRIVPPIVSLYGRSLPRSLSQCVWRRTGTHLTPT
jgi:hypothetical protein